MCTAIPSLLNIPSGHGTQLKIAEGLYLFTLLYFTLLCIRMRSTVSLLKDQLFVSGKTVWNFFIFLSIKTVCWNIFAFAAVRRQIQEHNTKVGQRSGISLTFPQESYQTLHCISWLLTWQTRKVILLWKYHTAIACPEILYNKITQRKLSYHVVTQVVML